MSANGMSSKPSQAPPGNPSNPPNQTLYIRNLNDKIAKPDLRRELYTLFSTYGHILDIVALKTLKMRGQAHVVYKDLQSSTQALQALQGVEFLGREMQISFGKGRSSIISKLQGTVNSKETSKQSTSTKPEPSKSSLAPPPPAGSLKAPNGVVSDGSKSPQGTKRPRDEEDSDEGEPMDEEDEGEAMDVSDED